MISSCRYRRLQIIPERILILLDLRLDETGFVLRINGNGIEKAMRRDHGVPVAAGNLGQKTLAILRVTLLFRRRKDSRARVQRLEGSRELRQGGRLNDNPRFFAVPRRRISIASVICNMVLPEPTPCASKVDSCNPRTTPNFWFSATRWSGSAGKCLMSGAVNLRGTNPLNLSLYSSSTSLPGVVVLFQPRLEFVLMDRCFSCAASVFSGVLHTGRFPVGVVMLVVDSVRFRFKLSLIRSITDAPSTPQRFRASGVPP